jgi:hypothetical protein
MGVAVLLFGAVFYFFRHVADRFLKITDNLGPWAVYVPKGAARAADRNEPEFKFYENLVATHDCVQFVAFFSIPLQMAGAIAPPVLLLSLCGADVAILIAQRSQMNQFLTMWPTIGVLVASAVTYMASLNCVAAGGCGGSAGLGWFLIILNAGVLLGIAGKPLRQSLSVCARCCALRSNDVQQGGPGTPVSPVTIEGTEVVCCKRVHVNQQLALRLPASSTAVATWAAPATGAPSQQTAKPSRAALVAARQAARQASRVSPGGVV